MPSETDRDDPSLFDASKDASRDDRAPKLRALADALRADGRHPYEIPIGASVPLGALGFVQILRRSLPQAPRALCAFD